MQLCAFILGKGQPKQTNYRLGVAQMGLGPPVVPFYPFLGEGSPTKIDCRRKGTLILTSLLEDLWENPPPPFDSLEKTPASTHPAIVRRHRAPKMHCPQGAWLSVALWGTHLSWAKKVLFQSTKTGNIGTPIAMVPPIFPDQKFKGATCAPNNG